MGIQLTYASQWTGPNSQSAGGYALSLRRTHVKDELPPLLLELADELFPVNLIDCLIDEYVLELVEVYVRRKKE